MICQLAEKWWAQKNEPTLLDALLTTEWAKKIISKKSKPE
jgi:hypothetical protein